MDNMNRLSSMEYINEFIMSEIYHHVNKRPLLFQQDAHFIFDVISQQKYVYLYYLDIRKMKYNTLYISTYDLDKISSISILLTNNQVNNCEIYKISANELMMMYMYQGIKYDKCGGCGDFINLMCLICNDDIMNYCDEFNNSNHNISIQIEFKTNKK